ncbi:MAG: sigma-54 dependent transcriptional regulator [Bryobacteraceae bacterium]
MILEAGNAVDAARLAEEHRICLAIVGEFGRGFPDSLGLIRRLRRAPGHPPAILFPASSSEEQVIAALREHVDDYVRSPDLNALADSVERFLALKQPPPTAAGMVGSSGAVVRARDYLSKLAHSDCPVLITGETGTGKELAARTIHDRSGRANAPFVAVNCAAIPESLFESEMFGSERGAFTGAVCRRDGLLAGARGGTVLLDEVGELPLTMQAKLLRTIETRQVVRLGGTAGIPLDLRFLAATNQPLEDMIRIGKFRADLYYRLAVTRVELPPLRERPEDIAELAAYFVRDLNRTTHVDIAGFDPEALAALVSHAWPGNVRELKNLIEAVAVETAVGTIGKSDFPSWFGRPLADVPAEVGERTAIIAALEQSHWNKSQAAANLRWSRMTLYRKLARHRIESRPELPASV